MGPTTMGRTLTTATIENLEDLLLANRGMLLPEEVRRITVTDALVDTGTTPAVAAVPTDRPAWTDCTF